MMANISAKNGAAISPNSIAVVPLDRRQNVMHERSGLLAVRRVRRMWFWIFAHHLKPRFRD
ncbi:MAG: hypothetical protein R3D43_11310 [Tepidamorphaceae bacterium]